jgi:peroxisomal 2,4-dienoyl-CoA reductase
VLNISATLHYHGTPLQVHASAAKAGVDAITRNLAVEWGRFGIRACGIAPGPIGDTEGMRRLATPEVAARAAAVIPAGRFGAIDEIAAAAVFLRSTAAAYVTGHTLVVDGGHSIATPSVAGV